MLRLWWDPKNILPTKLTHGRRGGNVPFSTLSMFLRDHWQNAIRSGDKSVIIFWIFHTFPYLRTLWSVCHLPRTLTARWSLSPLFKSSRCTAVPALVRMQILESQQLTSLLKVLSEFCSVEWIDLLVLPIQHQNPFPKKLSEVLSPHTVQRHRVVEDSRLVGLVILGVPHHYCKPAVLFSPIANWRNDVSTFQIGACLKYVSWSTMSFKDMRRFPQAQRIIAIPAAIIRGNGNLLWAGFSFLHPRKALLQWNNVPFRCRLKNSVAATTFSPSAAEWFPKNITSKKSARMRSTSFFSGQPNLLTRQKFSNFS